MYLACQFVCAVNLHYMYVQELSVCLFSAVPCTLPVCLYSKCVLRSYRNWAHQCICISSSVLLLVLSFPASIAPAVVRPLSPPQAEISHTAGSRCFMLESLTPFLMHTLSLFFIHTMCLCHKETVVTVIVRILRSFKFVCEQLHINSIMCTNDQHYIEQSWQQSSITSPHLPLRITGLCYNVSAASVCNACINSVTFLLFF